ncbi:hypothetical protein [Mycobacterium sp. 852002-51057_SCH5723018]|nr:hypothetical protein [Mycobacterium sp. 852002-51057_SCH5723018]
MDYSQGALAALVCPRPRGGLLPVEEHRRAFDEARKQVGSKG